MALTGISSMATRHVLADLVELAASDGLPRVEFTAVGGVEAARRVAAGESFDLVVLAAGALDELAADGHVDAATIRPLVLSQVAVGVPDALVERAGRPEGVAYPDAGGVRAALLEATKVGYSTGPSGTALLRHVEDWGLMDAVGDKLVQAPAGIPVAQLLAEGTVDLGFQQLSELVGQPGVRILGVLPDDCAIETTFSGAVGASASDPDAAAAVLGHFASGPAAAVKERHSFASH